MVIIVVVDAEFAEDLVACPLLAKRSSLRMSLTGQRAKDREIMESVSWDSKWPIVFAFCINFMEKPMSAQQGLSFSERNSRATMTRWFSGTPGSMRAANFQGHCCQGSTEFRNKQPMALKKAFDVSCNRT